MSVKHLFAITLLSICTTNCTSSETKPEEVSNDPAEMKVLTTGEEEIKELLTFINTDQIIINQTSSAELATLFGIEENEYYMNKKVTFEDHTLYINFTISKGVITKISYATLSNSPKEFSYIDDLITNSFGNDYVLSYNTNDSTINNASKTWNIDNIMIQYESFSDLNSGYELTIEESHPNN